MRLGRAIDADGSSGGGRGGGGGGSGGGGGGGGGGGSGGRPLLNRPPSNNSIGSMSRGMSEVREGRREEGSDTGSQGVFGTGRRYSVQRKGIPHREGV